MEWAPKWGKMTFGDIIRHIAAIERNMHGETILGKKSSYSGYDKKIMRKITDPVEYMDELHQESIRIFRNLIPEQLLEKVKTPGGIEITRWKWLRAIIEHEVHHRGHIYANLTNLGIKTPPLFGLTSEEVGSEEKRA
jgi:uncharacterized damage-inducible protein DinB